MSKENGGPAFPTGKQRSEKVEGVRGLRKIIDAGEGMSLRDYFATTATDEDIKPYLALDRFMSRQRARYMYANGMLVERAK